MESHFKIDFLGECAGRTGLPLFPFSPLALTLGIRGLPVCMGHLWVWIRVYPNRTAAQTQCCVLGGHPSSSQVSAAIFMRFLEREHVMVNILHEQQNSKSAARAAKIMF